MNVVRIIFVIFLYIFPFSAYAEKVYTWTDKDGVVHITNTPPQAHEENVEITEYKNKPKPSKNFKDNNPPGNIPDIDAVLKKYLFTEGNQSKVEKRNFLDDVLKRIGISNPVKRTEYLILGRSLQGLIIGLFFIIVGLAYLKFGIKTVKYRITFCGILLIVYPFFITDTGHIIVFGLVLASIPLIFRKWLY
jgi:hypothetical protein